MPDTNTLGYDFLCRVCRYLAFKAPWNNEVLDAYWRVAQLRSELVEECIRQELSNAIL